jgi:hypothetical protein
MNLEHLPQRCYTTNADGQLALILKGHMGYYLPIPSDQAEINDKDLQWNAKCLNEMLEVSDEEVDVMIGGSMFGWDSPLVQDFKKRYL